MPLPHYSLVVVDEPTSEPVTVDEAMDYLRLDNPTAADEAIVAAFITAAREHVEGWCGRALMPQTRRLALERFPRPERYGWFGWYYPQNLESPYAFHDYPAYEKMYLLITGCPVQHINTFQYMDTSGVFQTLTEGTGFFADLDSEPARLSPALGTAWPPTAIMPSTVKIEFDCGYPVDASGVNTVPESIKTAIKLLVNQWWENRIPVVEGDASEIPDSVTFLLDKFRVFL